MLRCVTGHAAVRTLLIDGMELVQAVGASLLSRALVQPRRRRAGARPLLLLYERHEGTSGLLRWDPEFIVPVGAAGAEASAKMRSLIGSSDPRSVQLTNRGDTLIIDNWRMIHGRSSVPAGCRDRLIERVYMGDIA